MKQKLADKLRQREVVPDTAPHLIVEARAGTGKTTVLIEGLKLLKGGHTDLTPSPQQELIWRSICQSKRLVDAKYVFTGSVCFVAFNKTIADELKRRVPRGVDAMTMHSMGLRTLRSYFEIGAPMVDGQQKCLEVDQYRVRSIINEIEPLKVIGYTEDDRIGLVRSVERLVSLCKMNFVGTGYRDAPTPAHLNWTEELSHFASHYDIDLNGNEREVFDLVPQVLERCKDVARDGCVDFDDMIWLPIVLNLDVYRYDLLLVDECQDLNRCQQQLALKAGRRLILIGDPKQAIYGFAGADGRSMQEMYRILSRQVTDGDKPLIGRGCTILPLTVTYRCGRAIVEEARKIVPDIEAHESCCNGKVSHNEYFEDNCEFPERAHYTSYVQPGDMVLCRVNAPLVSECFKFIRQGRKAVIRGRDIGRGLVATVRKMKADTTGCLNTLLADWYNKERTREMLRQGSSQSRLINLQDRYNCLLHFIEGSTSVQNVINRIQTIFNDDDQGREQGDKGASGILLSSIHKAKGLEAKRVFLLEPEGAQIPHPMAHTPEQIEQEWNLKYVAITRAIEQLIYVS